MFHVTTFILHLTLTLLHVKVQGYPDTGCSSTYQVWRPDENVLYRIRELEYKCTNDTLDWMHHLQQLKSKIVFESLSTRNLTHHIERSLLEQKLEDVNMKMSVKDLRLELSAMENRNIEVRSLLERWRQELQNGQVGNVGQVSMDTVSSMVTRVDTLDGVLSTVKNGVGDLKAEWLLIKREVQSIRSENTELSTSQSALQTKAGTIRSAIEEIQADTAALKNEQTEIRALTNKLQSTVNNVRSGDLLIGQSDDNDGAASIASLNVRMQSVERQNSNIERSIHRMRTEAQQLRHDLYSIIASVNNGSVADLQRIPLIEVPVLHLNHRPVNDVNGSHPRDCQDIFRRGYTSSGVYQIKPDGMLQLDNVYCEMVNSTGWTVIHRRRDGSLSFSRRWLEYLHGFGNPYGEFWLGNKIISAITNQDNYKLRVDIWSWEGERAYAEYDFFRVDGEKFNFRLHVRGFSGNAGDSLSYHDTMAFSTEDNDNDMFRRNCAEENKGGWWFNDCYSSNLNGIYHTGFYSQGGEKHSYADGIVWFTWKETEFYSLKYVEMKIKPARD